MKKTSKRPSPRITRGIVPTAIASGLLSPVTIGAPGDLDPGFGNMGRVASALWFDGPAWSVQPLAGDDSLFAGGFDYELLFTTARTTAATSDQLSGTGAPDSQFSAAALNSMESAISRCSPMARSSPWGVRFSSGSNVFTVLRLQPDGTIDTTFANQVSCSSLRSTGRRR